MRIISGNLKGRKYTAKAPDGTRPTTDSVRESIFNILNNYIDIEDANVIDICAGTGAMGIEALSRGAKECYFIDNNKKACKYIETALENFNISEDNYYVILDDAVKFLDDYRKNFKEYKFDLIFLDPPYQADIYNRIINSISNYGLLIENGIFVIEQDVSLGICLPSSFEIINEKVYGSTKVLFVKNK
jgi:16S rRNA (guanine966-N2)-methyltransferase